MWSNKRLSKEEANRILHSTNQIRNTTAYKDILRYIEIVQQDALKSMAMSDRQEDILRAQGSYNDLVEIRKLLDNDYAGPYQDVGG